MEIKYIATFWGKESMVPSEFIRLTKDAGYDGIELNVPFDGKFVTDLKNSIKESSMSLIAQQWLPPQKESVQEYRARLDKYLRHLAKLEPLFINSHTGKDFFSFEDNCTVIDDCLRLTKETGVEIFHETHRGRFPYHTSSLIPYLERYPELALNADFSHFCVVSESLLEDQEDLLEKIIPQCRYIHARVGFEESAQVNHPFAPEWTNHVNRFVGWWQKIIDYARQRGEKTFYVCPEFGPAPYMPALPYTQKPVADQWEINVQMMNFLRHQLS